MSNAEPAAKFEGTFFIDGLIEGRLPALPGAQERLAEGVGFARKLGLGFTLQVDGGMFNLLADNRPRAVLGLGGEVSQIVSAAVGDLLKSIPPGERGRISSTLRSVEYRSGEEVQTLYAIGADGTVQTQLRVIAARTIAGRTKARAGRIVMALLAVAAVIGVSAIFIDYREMWRSVRPMDASAIEVQSGFGEYFSVEGKSIGADGRSLVVLIKRRPGMPRTDEEFEAAAGSASFSQRLSLEALARGYVRVEYFDEAGRYRETAEARIKALRERETVELVLPLPAQWRTGRVVLTP